MVAMKTFSRFTNIAARIIRALLILVMLSALSPQAAQAISTTEPTPACPTLENETELSTELADQCAIPEQEIMDENQVEQALLAQEGGAGSHPQGILEGRVVKGRLRLWGTNFNPRHNFIVKIRATGISWRRIGTVSPRQNGTFESTYTIPRSMMHARIFEVCLKEVQRGYLVCTHVKNTRR